MVDRAIDEAAVQAEMARHVEAAASEEALRPRQKFCQLWPAAREGLVALQGVAPATVRAIIAIVVAAGDGAAANLCSVPQG